MMDEQVVAKAVAKENAGLLWGTLRTNLRMLHTRGKVRLDLGGEFDADLLWNAVVEATYELERYGFEHVDWYTCETMSDRRTTDPRGKFGYMLKRTSDQEGLVQGLAQVMGSFYSFSVPKEVASVRVQSDTLNWVISIHFGEPLDVDPCQLSRREAVKVEKLPQIKRLEDSHKSKHSQLPYGTPYGRRDDRKMQLQVQRTRKRLRLGKVSDKTWNGAGRGGL